MRRWIGHGLCGLAWSIVLVLVLGVFGTFAPAIPVLGIVGSALIQPFGPWLAALLVIAAICAVRPRHRRRPFYSLGSLALIAAVASSFAVIRTAAVARAAGIPLNTLEALLLAPVGGETGPTRDYAYAEFHGEKQHILVYPHRATSGPLPILVYVHGGGWVSGTRFDRETDMRWFAGQGLLVLSLDYALSSEHRHLSGRTESDLGCALATIAVNADKLGGDPRRMALVGDSAGGNLAINLGYRANAGTLRSACGGTVPRIAAVSAAYPVVDPANMYSNPDPALGHFARLFATYYIGGAPDRMPQRYRDVTASSNVTPNAPPTLLLIPKQDSLVPPAATELFAERAAAAGVRVRTIRIPYAGHAFDRPAGSIGGQIFRHTTLALLRSTVLHQKPTL